jgi:transcriptional regulator with XRE-family HTH domain
MLKISLAAARVNKSMTQEEAAKALHVSKKTIQNWEKGVSFPTVKMIEAICDLYDVSLDNLLFLPSDNA